MAPTLLQHIDERLRPVRSLRGASPFAPVLGAQHGREQAPLASSSRGRIVAPPAGDRKMIPRGLSH
jgi:hypothetical protein